MIFSCLIAIANVRFDTLFHSGVSLIDLQYAIYMATIDYMIAAYGPYSASATGGNALARDFLAGIAAMYSLPSMFQLFPPQKIDHSDHKKCTNTLDLDSPSHGRVSSSVTSPSSSPSRSTSSTGSVPQFVKSPSSHRPLRLIARLVARLRSAAARISLGPRRCISVERRGGLVAVVVRRAMGGLRQVRDLLPRCNCSGAVQGCLRN